MNPRIRWKSRHYLWVAIIIILAVFIYVKKYKTDETPIKDLTQHKTDDVSIKDLTSSNNERIQLNKADYDSNLEQITEGPYPFAKVEAVKESGNVFVHYTVGDKKTKILLLGVKLPANAEQSAKAMDYLKDFLSEQVLRVEIEGKTDEYSIGFVYAYNKSVESSEKSMVNIAMNLLSQGLVEVADDEMLQKSRYKDFLLGENDAAKLKKVGIYKVEENADKDKTEK